MDFWKGLRFVIVICSCKQWIDNGMNVIDYNRFSTDTMNNYDFAKELRSINQKLEVCYGEREELHQRFSMEQGILQRSEAECYSKDIALKDKDGHIS